MKTYTVADLRKNTRQILNEATTEPVLITRYDETFTLKKVEGEAFKPGVTDVPGGKVVVPEACEHGAAKGFCKVAKCPNSKR